MEHSRRARKQVGIAIAALLLAGVLAGCGGGSSTAASSSTAATATNSPSGTPTTAAGTQANAQSGPLSRHELAAKAEAICTHVELELLGITPKSASMAEIIRVVPERAADEQHAVDHLRQLTPPSALAHDWQLIVAQRQTLTNELDALVFAAKRKDSAAIKRLAASKKREHKLLLTTARRAGLYKCGVVG